MNILRKLLVLQFAVYLLDRATAQNEDFRLPKSVLPLNYKLELMTILDPLPGFERFTAPAKTWITVNCTQEVSVITMHAINLTINTNSVTVKNLDTNTDLPLFGTSYTEEFDFFHIRLRDQMEIGQKYEIYIEFVTPISGDRLNGMYQDFYEDSETGETRYIATTLFAPYHARRAFPCFDEPSFRATYDITLGHSNKYHAMSNTEIIQSRPIDDMPDWQWDTFETTPSISSYIIAMIVSDLDFEEGPENVFRNVSVRVYAKPQSIQQGAGKYSAKLAGDVMTFFESLFFVPYPITKLYSVALPQFFFNAMENWGLITYKEPILLYIPGETTEEERYKINYVLSHEKAHQYFGNLVSCNWWAYVWLKEGFATYYSHHGMNHTNPELLPWEQFITKVLQVAMEFDAGNETHPLENFPPTSPAVADIYTRIPYEKGASILRMTSSMITAPVFLSGIQQYVHNFQYQSAEQNNVFEMLQQAVDADEVVSSILPTSVKNILDTWTTQSGFPILSVTAVNESALQITQEKFIGGDPSNPTDTWWVPVYMSPRPNQTLPIDYPDAWIPQGVNMITIDIATDQLIFIDPNAIGYYRVMYDPKLLSKISSILMENHEILPASARSKLLNDYANLAVSGQTDFDTFFTLTSYLHNEWNLAVWQGLSVFLDRTHKLLSSTDAFNNFKTYFGEKAAKALQQLELANDNGAALELGATAILRSLLARLACGYDETSCVQKSLSLINDSDVEIRELLVGVPLSLQEATLCASIGHDPDGNLWGRIFNTVSNKTWSGFSPLKSRLVNALACTRNKTSLQSLINEVNQDGSFLGKAEKTDLLIKMLDNPLGKEVIMESLKIWPSEVLILLKSNGETFFDKISAYSLSSTELDTISSAAEILSLSQRQIVEKAMLKTIGNQELQERIVSTLKKSL